MTFPWYMKMGAKIVLARIPFSHRVWNRIGIFRHGKMQEFEYAHTVFTDHLHIAGLEDIGGNAGNTLLELGPGKSLFSALLAKAYGFRGSILVDVGNFSLPDIRTYQEFARWLQQRGLQLPSFEDCTDVEGMLSRLNAEYQTGGLSSLRKIPDRSVDFIFSQAVLEHVRRDEFAATAGEICRILAPGGVSTHVIDLKDHLQTSLNNLRFSEKFWESKLVRSSGFYTNRLRYTELIDIFARSGFQVEVVSKVEWGSLPLPKKVLAPDYRNMPDEILCISGTTVRLQ